MLVEVKVPQLSESVSEASLVNWHVKEGDFVKRDQNLVDLETDKIMMEIPAPSDGKIVSIVHANGSSVKTGDVIAKIDSAQKQEASDSASSGAKEAADSKSSTETKAASSSEKSKKTDSEVKPAQDAQTRSMPAARKLAADHGMNLNDVAGSGRGGRVTKQDILQTATHAAKRDERVPMTKLRAKIAERLLFSQKETASLTTFNEVNMQAIISLRKTYGQAFEKKYGVRLGFMSFFVKAVTFALKEYPIINASVDGNDIVYHNYFDIGVAIGSPRGLVVPVLRDADQMSLAQIEQAILAYAEKAKTGKLTMDDLTGGTFSISNGGVFGSMLSTPIINPPQSAILGIHATKERPVVENGEIVIRPMNYLAISYDHRIIDGREAVLFLVAIKNALEDPSRLVLGI